MAALLLDSRRFRGRNVKGPCSGILVSHPYLVDTLCNTDDQLFADNGRFLNVPVPLTGVFPPDG